MLKTASTFTQSQHRSMRMLLSYIDAVPYTLLHLVFPLPDGPIIAFTPAFIIPLQQEEEETIGNYIVIAQTVLH